MVPVRLRLTNFLSYGSRATELDFSKFHVACLSGRNGQGKSALLDAITWALWGKTERSRGHANLVRTGSEPEPMRVEFEFDIEYSRYRVVRIFEKGAHRLELHHDGGEAHTGYRLMSGTGVKTTQKAIELAVGLDYPTFINSAYLLQGRSNEFTRGSPGERKEILGKILNIERYERLRLQAGREKSRASAAVESADTRISQLSGQIEKAPKLKSKHNKLTQAASDKAQELSRVSKTVQELVGRISQLESWEKSSSSLAIDIAHLTAQIEQSTSEKVRVETQIELASALIEKSETIRQRLQEKVAFDRERQLLETKRETYLDLTRQRDRFEKDLAYIRSTYEKKLARFAVRRAQMEQQIQDLEATEARRPGVWNRLTRARKSHAVEAQLRRVKEKVDALDSRINASRLELEKERLSISAKLAPMEESLQQMRREEQQAATVIAHRDALTERLAERPQLEAELQATEETGARLAAQKNMLDGKIEAWQSELTERNEQISYLLNPEAGKCPTCGTELTETHRQKVGAELQTAVEDLKSNIRAGGIKSTQLDDEVSALRHEYRKQDAKLKGMDRDQETLAALEVRAREIEKNRAQEKGQAAEVDRIRAQLRDSSYLPEVQSRLANFLDQRKNTHFDTARYEEALRRAGETRPLENELSLIDAKLRDKSPLISEWNALKREMKRNEQLLEGGAAITDLLDKIGHVGKQMDTLGYDRERLETVGKALAALATANEDHSRLLEAKDAMPRYAQRLESLEQDIRNASAKRQLKQQQQYELLEALSHKGVAEEDLLAKRAEQRQVQQRWGELQADIGKVEERLQQIERCRKERKLTRRKKRRAKEDVIIFGHLQEAFSRRGIPALIIEQSVYEIEQRANQLLDRLTEGKMSVQIQMVTEKLTGGTKETLEIRVNDELGTYRPYETYSGGEAFRINIALRIALSQLLAARSGVPIRTLVIDEGFGTQDQQGIQCIVDVIDKVRNDFEKILIVTHLEAVKEAFPVRIEVVKDPATGSELDMIGM